MRTPKPWTIRKRDGSTESLTFVSEFQDRVAAGAITQEDVISRDGRRWLRIGDIVGLKPLFASETVAAPRRSRQATMIGIPASTPAPSHGYSSQGTAPKHTLVGMPTPLTTAATSPGVLPSSNISQRNVQRTIIGVPLTDPTHPSTSHQSTPIGTGPHVSRTSSIRRKPSKLGEYYFMQGMLWLSRLPKYWLWIGMGTLGIVMWILAFVLMGSVLTGCDCTSWETHSQDKKPEVLELHLTEAPSEEPYPLTFGSRPLPLHKVLEHLHALNESHTRGLFIRLEPMEGAWARMEDLVEGLKEARKAQKPIYCHFEEADNVSYALAAAGCDRITMSPAGMINLTGTAVEVLYARELLDKVGIQAQMLQIGRYKGAADSLTHKTMPPESRESLEAIVNDLQDSLIQGLRSRKTLHNAQIHTLFEHGPYTPEDALKAGLIDAIEFADQTRYALKTQTHTTKVTALSSDDTKGIDISELVKQFTSHSKQDEKSSEPRIALMVLEGTIVDADSDGANGIRSAPVIQALRHIEYDDAIKSVVLRINSPGGSALASDEIWHAVRSVVRKKPVIASIGDMAASGGYYIASASTTIMAQRTSLVGSIGVVGGKISVAGVAEKLGVHAELIQSTSYGGWLSPLRPFSESQQQRLHHLLQTTYDRFLKRVAEGRNKPENQIELAAQGRLFTAQRAQQAGLIDAFGGLGAALAKARTLGYVDASTPIEIWPEQKNLGEILIRALGGVNTHTPQLADNSRIQTLVSQWNTATTSSPLLFAFLNSHQPVLCVLPYQLETR